MTPIAKNGPRGVQPTPMMVLLKTAIPLVYAAITFFFWYVAYLQVSELDGLRTHGLRVDGTVTSKFEGSGRSPTFHLEYAFLANGVDQLDEVKVGHDEYVATLINSPITITYMPDDPSIHRVGIVDQGEVDELRRNWQLFLLVITIGAAAVYGFLSLSYKAESELLRNGIAEEASVTEVVYKKSSRTILHEIHYEYDAGNGLRAHGLLLVSGSEPFTKKGAVLPYLHYEDQPFTGKFLPQLKLAGLNEQQPA